MLYAKSPKAVPQALSDFGFLMLIGLMIFIADKVRDFINLFAVPAQKTAEAAENLAVSLGDVSEQVGNVPVVGGGLKAPFEALEYGMNGLVDSALGFVTLVNTAALILAIVVFLVPIAFYVYKWFPWRYAFIREATAGKKLLTATGAAELFALRAMAHASMHDLAKISEDPMGAWRAGDQRVIAKLAELELSNEGLRLPAGQKKALLSGTFTSDWVTDPRKSQSEQQTLR